MNKIKDEKLRLLRNENEELESQISIYAGDKAGGNDGVKSRGVWRNGGTQSRISAKNSNHVKSHTMKSQIFNSIGYRDKRRLFENRHSSLHQTRSHKKKKPKTKLVMWDQFNIGKILLTPK